MPPRALRTPRPTASSRLPNACSRRRFRSRSLANASGLCFPSTGTASPVIVERFLDRLALGGCDYVYAVVTCGGSAGGTADAAGAAAGARDGAVRRVFGADARQLHPAFSPPKAESARRCSRRPTGGWTPSPPPSRRAVCIRRRFRRRQPLSGLLHRYYESHRGVGEVPPTTAARLRPLCALCPERTISLSGRPVWQGECTRCLACLHPLSRRRDTVRPRYGKAGAVCQPQGDVLSGLYFTYCLHIRTLTKFVVCGKLFIYFLCAILRGGYRFVCAVFPLSSDCPHRLNSSEDAADRSCGNNAIGAAFDACSRNISVV